jgi:hypothetical protein
MGRIRDAWESFESVVIPVEAGPTQRTEMRKAFYAGAATFYGELFGNLSDGEDTEEADLELINELRDELVEFGESAESEEVFRMTLH